MRCLVDKAAAVINYNTANSSLTIWQKKLKN